MKPTRESRFVRPANVRVVRAGGGYVCYNSLTSTCLVANGPARRLLERFARPLDVRSLQSRPAFRGWRGTLSRFEERRLIVPVSRDLRDAYVGRFERHLAQVARGRVLRNLTLVVNEACNFSCTYCVEHAMLRGGGRPGEQGRRMSAETLDVALRAYFELLKESGARTGDIGFSGGEPLLNWPIVKRAMAEASRIGREAGLRDGVRFGFNSNGSLLTPEIADEIARYRVGVISIGIDGVGPGNDLVRRHRNGEGTLDSIMRGLRIARRHIRARIEINTVLTEATWPFITREFLAEVKREGASAVTIEPDLVNFPTLDIGDMADRLADLVECGHALGVRVLGGWLRPAERFARGRGIAMFHCLSQGGRNIAVTSTGRVGVCSYCSPTFGHVSGLRAVLSSPAYLQFVRSRLNTQIAFCRGCSLEGACAGGCYVPVDGRAGDPRRCELYRTVTDRLLARWSATS